MVENKYLKHLDKEEIGLIDTKILIFCLEEAQSISELRKKIDIAFHNLRPHLHKLAKMGLLEIDDSGKGKKKWIKTTDSLQVLYFIFGIICLYTPEAELRNKKNRKLLYEIESFYKKNSISDRYKEEGKKE